MHLDEPNSNIENVERLINRRLDHQISPAEDAQLDQLLASNPDARAMMSDYLQLDQCAAQALQADVAMSSASTEKFASPVHLSTARLSPRSSGLRLTIAAAVLSAAAVIAFSLLPDLWNTRTIDSPVVNRAPRQSQQFNQPVPAQFVDYKPSDFLPVQRQRDLQRDLIGVRGDNPNVIYVFERNTLSTRLVPIMGDF